MKKSWVGGVAKRASGVVALMLLAAGVFVAQSAVAGIASTKHNLGTNGTGTNHLSAGTAEICVFCHTPHGADTTAAVPLWNRVLGASTSYTTYNSLGTSSLDGATAPVGSVSLACLSCHDGAQSMSVMINQPGSGGYVVAGANLSGSAWAGTNQSAGKIAGTDLITLIGTDLKNDHPIGIQYGGGLANNATFGSASINSGTTRDPDFNTAVYVNLNNNPVWYVDRNGNGSRDKSDMLLYTRNGDNTAAVQIMTQTKGVASGTMTGVQAFVECASCHDPHNSTNATFLRVANDNSAVCLACHIK